VRTRLYFIAVAAVIVAMVVVAGLVSALIGGREPDRAGARATLRTPALQSAVVLNVTATASAVNPGREEARFVSPLKAWSRVTDRFGAPRSGGLNHTGIDLALDEVLHHSPVFAACDGVVTDHREGRAYGIHVVVDCGAGWSTLYGHLDEILVPVGSVVLKGETMLGITGSTGLTTGEHLHFEIRLNDQYLNAERYIDFKIEPGAPLSYDDDVSLHETEGEFVAPSAQDPQSGPGAASAAEGKGSATPTPAAAPRAVTATASTGAGSPSATAIRTRTATPVPPTPTPTRIIPDATPPPDVTTQPPQ
jgi:hypothetical protein